MGSETVCFSRRTLLPVLCLSVSHMHLIIISSVKELWSSLNFSKSQTISDVSVQLPAQFELFIISVHFVTCGFSLPFIDHSYLCKKT